MIKNFERIRNWTLLVSTSLLCLVLLELLSGVLYARFGGAGKDMVEAVLSSEHGGSSIQIHSSGGHVSHPYLLYVNTPNYFAYGLRQHNSMGYRGAEIDPAKGRIRVLVLGGSTTYSWSVHDPNRTWVAQFEALFPKQSVQVINAGVAYATSAEILARYMFRDRYLKPDVVIFHEGGNDVIPLWYPNYNPEYSHFRGPGFRPVVGPLERMLLRFNLFRYLYARNWTRTLGDLTHLVHPYNFDKIKDEDAERGSSSGSVEGFERNLDLLIRNIKADGALPIIFGFLQAQEAFLSKNRPELVGKEKALVIGLARNYEVMRRIAKKYNVPFVDPQQEKFPPSVFVDNCHLNEEGEGIKAGILFDAVSEEILMHAKIPGAAN